MLRRRWKNQRTDHRTLFHECLVSRGIYAAGAESVETDNNYGKDLKADGVAKFRMPNGRIIKNAWEYETKECKHSIKDLQEKRDSLVLARDASGACCYDEVIFISKKEYTPHLIEALGGDDYTLVRGRSSVKWLESIKAQNSCAILPQLVKNGARRSKCYRHCPSIIFQDRQPCIQLPIAFGIRSLIAWHLA